MSQPETLAYFNEFGERVAYPGGPLVSAPEPTTDAPAAVSAPEPTTDAPAPSRRTR